MALIKCPDCRKEISDQSTSCIYCGCPVIQEQKHQKSSIQLKEGQLITKQWNRKLLIALRLIAAFSFFIVIIILMTTISNESNIQNDTKSNIPSSIPKITPTKNPTSTPSLTPTPVITFEDIFVSYTSNQYISSDTSKSMYKLLTDDLQFTSISCKQKISDTSYKVECNEYELVLVFANDTIDTVSCGTYYLYENGEIKYTKQDLLDRSTDEKRASYWEIAKDMVKQCLKVPSSAEFPSIIWNSSEISMQRNKSLVAVSSYVESQNSFGVMIRNYFVVQFFTLDNVSYMDLYLEVGGEVIYGEWIDFND